MRGSPSTFDGGSRTVPEPLATVKRIAAFGLSAKDPTDISIEANSWPSTIAWLVGQRLTGLAVAAHEVGALKLGDEEAAELHERHVGAMVVALQIERGLLRLAPKLHAAGVEFVVLKGPALACAFYPDPSWRSYGDLDLLVRTRDWRAACALLADSGFHRALPEPRSGFDERFGKAAMHVDAAGLQVDLHRTLTLGPFGLWLEPNLLFEPTAPLPIGGTTLRRLDDTTALIHACVHAALGSRRPRILPLRDVAQISMTAAVDWEELERLIQRWRLRAVVAGAMDHAETQLGIELPPPSRRLREIPADRRERRALAAYMTERRTRGGTALSSLQAIPGLRPKAAYVRAMLMPDRAFLTARAEGRRGTYLRRWLIPIRWAFTGRSSKKRTRR
jgi:putative nucleotidyltransferase-like protein